MILYSFFALLALGSPSAQADPGQPVDCSLSVTQQDGLDPSYGVGSVGSDVHLRTSAGEYIISLWELKVKLPLVTGVHGEDTMGGQCSKTLDYDGHTLHYFNNCLTLGIFGTAGSSDIKIEVDPELGRPAAASIIDVAGPSPHYILGRTDTYQCRFQ